MLQHRVTGSAQLAVCNVDWAASPWSRTSVVADVLRQQEERKRREKAQNPTGPVSVATTDDRSEPEAPVGAPFITSQSTSGGEATAVVSFLRSCVPRWAPRETAMAVGMDSMDMVQMRNAFVRKFKAKASLSLFNTPRQTLGQLAQKLESILQVETDPA